MTDSARALDGSRALVTGASGFVGRHLCRALRAAGVEVVGAARRRPVDASAITSAWHEVDLAEPARCQRLMREVRPDLIFHLAGLVGGSRDRALVRPMLEANLSSTVALLEGAAEQGCRRFVQLGSLEEPADSSQAPCSPYAAAKAAATGYARMFAELYGVPAVVARVFMVYGPGPQDETKLVPYVITRLLAGEPLSLSSGARPVDWIYVEDVAAGLVALAAAPGASGRVVDIGSGELVSVRDVVRGIYRRLAAAQEPPLGTLPDRVGEPVVRAAIEETAALLAWRPAISLEQGLERTVAWFREAGAPSRGAEAAGR